MVKEVQLTLNPERASDFSQYKQLLEKKSGIADLSPEMVKVINRSIDARSANIKINLRLKVADTDGALELRDPQIDYPNVSNQAEVVIVGSGPAGLFAALRCIEQGVKPIIIERGNDVRARRKDLAAVSRQGDVNPNSNYCFGEGGAGTYSDGKLYTRSKKRGDVKRILQILHQHGAADDILFEAHPHIGTNRLPRIITAIRNTILQAGGQVHFNRKLTDIDYDSSGVRQITVTDTLTGHSETLACKALMLATGHSAHDVYHLLQQKKIALEAKPFAMGVRVEHPQALIDTIQYKRPERGPHLPAAAYSLVMQSSYRGVYSFCMCPGGYIVPATTNPGQQVVNGMSPGNRNSPYANSGIVVEITLDDLKFYKKHGPLAGLHYQSKFEKLAFTNGGPKLAAPAQRLQDFVSNTQSDSIPKVSYHPGAVSSPMHKWIPGDIRHRLQHGFKYFDKVMKGYLTNEAVILGVESRSSSPVRIPRDPETLQHIQIGGLFPCGEGAGYAGGIVSAAIDGEKSAEKAAAFVRV